MSDTYEPTEDEIVNQALDFHRRVIDFEIEQLIFRCLEYDKESRRSDRLHAARMAKRRSHVICNVKFTYYVLTQPPLSEDGLESARRWLIRKHAEKKSP
ncbi:hypothetical protein [Terasakiella sp.]|uniref:hypothetical protein n=1 Tax=Terasakiella sp. TaxID=2034861 RepID=UPI003AA84270